MSRILSLFVAVLIGFAALPALAASQDDIDILAVKHRIQALHDLGDAGVVTRGQVEQGEMIYLAKARALSPELDSVAAVMAVPEMVGEPSDSTGQRLRRFLGAVNIIWVGSIIIAVASAAVLGFYIIPPLLGLFAAIPLVVYEVAMWAGSLSAMVFGRHVTGWGEFIGLTGCLGLAGTMALSGHLRKLEPSAPRFFGLLLLAWVPTAMWYGSPMIGFAAVAALMGLLGFSAAVTPLCYAVGFTSEDAVPRGTAVGLLMVGVFSLLRTAMPGLPVISVFSTGALFLGSFVGYLGLLIMSSRWYVFGNDRNGAAYVELNMLTVAAGVAAITLGTYFSIPQVQQIGGTFFVLYGLEKVCEIPAKSAIGWAFVGLVLAGTLWVVSAIVTAHAALLQPYLLF